MTISKAVAQVSISHRSSHSTEAEVAFSLRCVASKSIESSIEFCLLLRPESDPSTGEGKRAVEGTYSTRNIPRS